MPLNAKTDFSAILKDSETEQELLRFKATISSDLLLSVGFEGGGIASAGQELTISTEKKYDYQANKHCVVVLGRTFIISSVRISFRKPLGARGKIKEVYILELQ